MNGCEVEDWTLTADGTLAYRQLNEAARVELARRGTPTALPSGELIGDAIVWLPTPGGCGAGWTEEGTTAP